MRAQLQHATAALLPWLARRSRLSAVLAEQDPPPPPPPPPPPLQSRARARPQTRKGASFEWGFETICRGPLEKVCASPTDLPKIRAAAHHAAIPRRKPRPLQRSPPPLWHLKRHPAWPQTCKHEMMRCHGRRGVQKHGQPASGQRCRPFLTSLVCGSNVYGNGHGHVYGHVCGNGHGHVYGCVYGNLRRSAWMCMGTMDS